MENERRHRAMTDADLEVLAEKISQKHCCRFPPDVQTGDLMFVKDLISIYKETRSEVIKWVVRGVVYGTLLLIAIGGYFKMKE